MTLDGDAMAIPVSVVMQAYDVAVSWFSDNDPGGDWTATLQRRAEGEMSFSDVATFTFATS